MISRTDKSLSNQSLAHLRIPPSSAAGGSGNPAGLPCGWLGFSLNLQSPAPTRIPLACTADR
ncbi:hypothetical protein SH449x_004664 [Pirellulaceae bacterium SH449]